MNWNNLFAKLVNILFSYNCKTIYDWLSSRAKAVFGNGIDQTSMLSYSWEHCYLKEKGNLWITECIGVSGVRVVGFQSIDFPHVTLSDGMKFHFFWFGYRTPNCSPMLLRILRWPSDQIGNDHELHLWSTPGGRWKIWNTGKSKYLYTFLFCQV